MPKGRPEDYKVPGDASSGPKDNFGGKVSTGAKIKPSGTGRRFGQTVSDQARKKRRKKALTPKEQVEKFLRRGR